MNHVYAEVSDELRGLARKSTNAADQFIEEAERLRVAGEYAKAKQMTGAARDLAVITGISLDKSMPIDERPNEKRGQDQQADLYRFLQELERRGAIAKGSINPLLTAGPRVQTDPSSNPRQPSRLTRARDSAVLRP
jgi:hypothetical protein